ncbi:MAG: RNA methyltransferase [Oscillospiraceae bacterium]|nr:RNA methyltransferase [Oscillospiraceae bacterium]
MREIIVSRDNPLVKLAVKLASSKSARRDRGLFLCDGPTLLPEALARGAEIYAVLCRPGAALPRLPAGVRVAELPERLLGAISPTDTPQGLVFLCRRPDAERLDAGWPGFSSPSLYIALDRVQDPGNVGSILRTCDAFSVGGVLLGPGCADPYSPKAVRASMGAIFGTPVYECGSADEGLWEILSGCPLPVYAAAPAPDAVDVRDVDLSSGVLLLGNEGAGLSAPLMRRADIRVRIPTGPACQSLGVAAAAAILLWESKRAGESKRGSNPFIHG